MEITPVGVDQTPWTAYTPTAASSGGAVTVVSASGRFKRIGKTVYYRATLAVTGGSGVLQIGVPSTPFVENYTGAGYDSSSRSTLAVNVGGVAYASVTQANGAYPVAGNYHFIAGFYEEP